MIENATVEDLLKKASGLKFSIITGYGAGYGKLELKNMARKVQALVVKITDLDPTIAIEVVPINHASHVREIESKTTSQMLVSSVLVHVTPTSVKVGKWRNNQLGIGALVELD